MATSTIPKKRNRFKLHFLSLLLVTIFLFFFSRRALDHPNLLFYRDLVSQTPAPLLLLSPPSRSTDQFHANFDGLTQPISSEVPDPVGDNVDGNTTLSSDSSEPEVKETVSISSETESEDDSGEITGEPTSSDDEATLAISSKSDLDDKPTLEITTAPLVSSEPETEDDSGEITVETLSSDDETTLPISSKSDIDDKTSVKPEILADNAIMEKLRKCDIYKGKWVRDEGYPHYEPGSCPYVDDGFDCQRNGRPDSEYLKWRWQPDDCDLPRFIMIIT